MIEAVIFDVDGTLADVSGMRHYVLDDPRRKNFDAFHKSAAYFAPANLDVIEAMHAARAAGQVPLVFTARREQWRYYTTLWLKKWNADFDFILMRSNTDFRRDVEVKRDMLRRVQNAGYNIVHAWDDNPAIVELWRVEGIPVTVVPGWDHGT